MTNAQWTALQEATRGHTPGPWTVSGRSSPGDSTDIIGDDGALWYAGWATKEDTALTAAAPDLLAEVERLRGWLEYLIAAEAVVTRQYTTIESTAPLLANSARVLLARALNGEEVPK